MQSSVPTALLLSLKDGRYAVRLDDSCPFMFMRIKTHDRGRLKGITTFQTQHGENLKERGFRHAGNDTNVAQVYDRDFDDHLLLAAISPIEAGIDYARELGRCCRCGKELTDERSRWFGIGPECEKHNPDFVDHVESLVGPYVPSSELAR